MLYILDKIISPYKFFISYPLTRWKILPIPETARSSKSSSSLNKGHTLSKAEAIEIAQPLSHRGTPKVAQLPPADKLEHGTWIYIVGTQEGEWLRSWEEKIVEGVKRRRKGELGGKEKTVDRESDSLNTLRGYESGGD